jgi:hypothetical protein
MNTPATRPLPELIVKQRADWWRGYVVWVAIHWTFSAVATVSAALAAALPGSAKVFGIVATAASALIGVGNPYRHASGFSRAHRRLNQACLAYECDEKVSVETLLTAHEEGEQIIEKTEE